MLWNRRRRTYINLTNENNRQRRDFFKNAILETVEKMSDYEVTFVEAIRYTPELAAADRAPCVLCLEEKLVEESVVEFSCKHAFHADCAARALTNDSRCPLCRRYCIIDYSFFMCCLRM